MFHLLIGGKEAYWWWLVRPKYKAGGNKNRSWYSHGFKPEKLFTHSRKRHRGYLAGGIYGH